MPRYSRVLYHHKRTSTNNACKVPVSFPHLSITTYCRKPPPVQVWRLWGAWGFNLRQLLRQRPRACIFRSLRISRPRLRRLSATPTLSQRARICLGLRGDASHRALVPACVPGRGEGRLVSCSMPCTAGIGFASILQHMARSRVGVRPCNRVCASHSYPLSREEAPWP